MQIPAPSDGYYFSNSSQTCVACSYWTREKKSCDAENAAAKAKTCHLHGENNLDKVCYSRQETQGVCVCVCMCVSMHASIQPTHIVSVAPDQWTAGDRNVFTIGA